MTIFMGFMSFPGPPLPAGASGAILVNMFTKNKPPAGRTGKRRRRGRPPGPTARGAETRAALFRTAIDLFARQGYEATTLRQIAARAGASPALLYRYFPGKRAVVLALYDELSLEYAGRTRALPAGRWRERFMVALRTSLAVLAPHRSTLVALVPVLVGGREESLFAPATAFSRERVQRAFVEAVTGASDAPRGGLAPALGRVLYLVHLALVLWWLLDRSEDQRATAGLVAVAERALPPFALALRVPLVGSLLCELDAAAQAALYGETASGANP
jgi:AcrR family transcriptional regulator